MRDEIFADSIGEITVSGTTVRVDLMTLSLTDKDEGGRLKSTFGQRVIFPIEGFAHATEAMYQMREQLIQRGALKRTENTDMKMNFSGPNSQTH